MTPVLPAELVARILALANERPSVAERQQNRNALRSVNRVWSQGADWVHEVCLQGYEIAAFVRRYSAETCTPEHAAFAGTVKRLYIDNDVRSSKDSRRCSHAEIISALKLCLNIELLELHLLSAAYIESDVTAALASIVKIKHFTLNLGSSGTATYVRVLMG